MNGWRYNFYNQCRAMYKKNTKKFLQVHYFMIVDVLKCELKKIKRAKLGYLEYLYVKMHTQNKKHTTK